VGRSKQGKGTIGLSTERTGRCGKVLSRLVAALWNPARETERIDHLVVRTKREGELSNFRFWGESQGWDS